MSKRDFSKPPSFFERYWLTALSVGILGYLSYWSAKDINISWERVSRGLPSAGRIFMAMVPPNTEYTGRVMQGLLESFHIAILGTALASLIAIPVGFLAARNASRHPALYGVGKFVLNAVRTFPEILLAIIIMRGVGPGAFCGILAMGLHSVGMLGKLYAEAIESIDPSPIEALTSTGASRIQVLWYAVFPQVLPEFASFALYRLEINIRSATVLGIVGAGGIGKILMANLTYRLWSNVGMILLGIIIMVIIIDRVSGKLRSKLV